MHENSNIERKTFACSVKSSSEPEGIVEAIVSVFSNIDAAQERVLPGFFRTSLERKLPKGVWMHDWTLPVAKTLEARELLPGDPALPVDLAQLGGLYVKAQFNLKTQRGREAFEDLVFGTVDEFSIGYRVTKDAYDSNSGVRDLVEGDLFEWSPVLVGCNSATALISAKEAPHAGLPFADHASTVRDAVTGLIQRAREIADLRAKDGRRMGPESREHLSALKGALEEGAADVAAMLAEPNAPVEKTADSDVSGVLAQYVALEARLSGVTL